MNIERILRLEKALIPEKKESRRASLIFLSSESETKSGIFVTVYLSQYKSITDKTRNQLRWNIYDGKRWDMIRIMYGFDLKSCLL